MNPFTVSLPSLRVALNRVVPAVVPNRPADQAYGMVHLARSSESVSLMTTNGEVSAIDHVRVQGDFDPASDYVAVPARLLHDIVNKAIPDTPANERLQVTFSNDEMLVASSDAQFRLPRSTATAAPEVPGLGFHQDPDGMGASTALPRMPFLEALAQVSYALGGPGADVSNRIAAVRVDDGEFGQVVAASQSRIQEARFPAGTVEEAEFAIFDTVIPILDRVVGAAAPDDLEVWVFDEEVALRADDLTFAFRKLRVQPPDLTGVWNSSDQQRPLSGELRFAHSRMVEALEAVKVVVPAKTQVAPIAVLQLPSVPDDPIVVKVDVDGRTDLAEVRVPAQYTEAQTDQTGVAPHSVRVALQDFTDMIEAFPGDDVALEFTWPRLLHGQAQAFVQVIDPTEARGLLPQVA